MTNTQNDQPTEETSLHQGIGTRLAPLFTWRGRDVYPLFGAEGDDGDDSGADSDPGTDEEEDAGEGGSGEGSAPVTREEFDKLRNQLSAADKRRDAAEKKLKDIEDSKKDELTKATEQVAELTKQREVDQKEISQLRLQNAFLGSNTGITWHDPSDALALAERQGYLDEVVGEDGKVDQGKLTAKLKELAKAKPHLVKTSGEDKPGKEAPKPPTGQKVGSKVNSGGGKSDALPDRYAKHFR